MSSHNHTSPKVLQILASRLCAALTIAGILLPVSPVSASNTSDKVDYFLCKDKALRTAIKGYKVCAEGYDRAWIKPAAVVHFYYCNDAVNKGYDADIHECQEKKDGPSAPIPTPHRTLPW